MLGPKLGPHQVSERDIVSVKIRPSIVFFVLQASPHIDAMNVTKPSRAKEVLPTISPQCTVTRDHFNAPYVTRRSNIKSL